MPDSLPVFLEGGATLIFDDGGRLKYRISNSIFDRNDPAVQARQSKRLKYLWYSGYFSNILERRASTRDSAGSHFAALHRARGMSSTLTPKEAW
jgi:hypothetical protein